jgi:hypothetical protein
MLSERKTVIKNLVDRRAHLLERMYKIMQNINGKADKQKLAAYMQKNLEKNHKFKLDLEIELNKNLKDQPQVLKSKRKRFLQIDNKRTEIGNSSFLNKFLHLRKHKNVENVKMEILNKYLERDTSPEEKRKRITNYGRWFLKSTDFNRKITPNH